MKLEKAENWKELTERESEVLKYVIDYKSVNGISPSLREIGTGLCMSRMTAARHIATLEEKEYITIAQRKHRTIRVVKFL